MTPDLKTRLATVLADLQPVYQRAKAAEDVLAGYVFRSTPPPEIDPLQDRLHVGTSAFDRLAAGASLVPPGDVVWVDAKNLWSVVKQHAQTVGATAGPTAVQNGEAQIMLQALGEAALHMESQPNRALPFHRVLLAVPVLAELYELGLRRSPDGVRMRLNVAPEVLAGQFEKESYQTIAKTALDVGSDSLRNARVLGGWILRTPNSPLREWAGAFGSHTDALAQALKQCQTALEPNGGIPDSRQLSRALWQLGEAQASVERWLATQTKLQNSSQEVLSNTVALFANCEKVIQKGLERYNGNTLMLSLADKGERLSSTLVPLIEKALTAYGTARTGEEMDQTVVRILKEGLGQLTTEPFSNRYEFNEARIAIQDLLAEMQRQAYLLQR